MPSRRGPRTLLSAACCAILIGLVASLYIFRPLASLNKAHRRFVIPNKFCGCLDDVAIYVKSGGLCPAGLQGKATGCLRSSSLYQNFVPRTVASSTSAAAAPGQTAEAGVTSIVVSGLAQGCSETAASCSTSYSFSWAGGAAAPTSATGGTASTTQPSLLIPRSAHSSSTTMIRTCPTIALMSTFVIKSMRSSTSPPMTSSISASSTSSCPIRSGIQSSWTTTETLMENYAVVLSTYMAGFGGVTLLNICPFRAATWMPVATTSSAASVSALSESSVPSAASDVCTTTTTAQQGVNSIILALENVIANNGATEVLSTLSSSTMSPPSSTSISVATTASSAAMNSSYTNSSIAQNISASTSYPPGATWMTTTTVGRGSNTVVYVDLVSKAFDGTPIVTQISASTVKPVVEAGLQPTISQILPIPANASSLSGNTGISFHPSSISLVTVTITAPSPFTFSLILVTSTATSTVATSTARTKSAAPSSFTAITSGALQTTRSPISSFLANTAWTPGGSIFSTQSAYIINDGVFGGVVVVGESSWLVTSINAQSTQTIGLGASVVPILPCPGTSAIGTATQCLGSVITTGTASRASATTSLSLTTSAASTCVVVAPVTALRNSSRVFPSQSLGLVSSPPPIITTSSTWTTTTTIISISWSLSGSTDQAISPTSLISKRSISSSTSLNFTTTGNPISVDNPLPAPSTTPASVKLRPTTDYKHTSTYSTSIFCNPDVGKWGTSCYVATKTLFYETTWVDKRGDTGHEAEETKVPSEVARDVDEAGNDGPAEEAVTETSRPIFHVAKPVSTARLNSEIRRRKIHPFQKRERIPQTLDYPALNAAISAPTVVTRVLLPAFQSPTTSHPAHNTRACNKQQLSARAPQGITICAEANCASETVSSEPHGTTICAEANCGETSSTSAGDITICAEADCGDTYPTAAFIPDSPAQRIYRGVRWCLPWFGFVIFEMVFGIVMAGMWTLAMFWEW